MHGHLHPGQRIWRCEDPFGISFPRAPLPSRVGIQGLRTTASAAVSMRTEQRRWEAWYPEHVKSVKERCIRVAAIDIMISAGV